MPQQYHPFFLVAHHGFFPGWLAETCSPKRQVLASSAIHHPRAPVSVQACLHAHWARSIPSVRPIHRPGGSPIHRFRSLSLPATHQGRAENIQNRQKNTPKDEHHYITEFKGTFYDLTDEVPEDCQMWERAGQILFYLEVFESKSERESGRPKSSIQDLSHWDYIKWFTFYA